MTLRAPTAADVAAIAAIYNEGIEGREATFETRLREPEEVAGWLHTERPFVVAEEGGEVVGWARAQPYADRCAYDGIAEFGVYVAVRARGRGIGRALLSRLAADAESAGLHKLTSRVFTTNTASRALHRACGFAEIGVARRHAQLDGEWKDCVIVERLLGEAAAA
ncbi:MAG: arsinothricin resistance N-acetyltransferase ArsN1 family A [Solirubrobacteraceae bacterium]